MLQSTSTSARHNRVRMATVSTSSTNTRASVGMDGKDSLATVGFAIFNIAFLAYLSQSLIAREERRGTVLRWVQDLAVLCFFSLLLKNSVTKKFI